MAKRRRFTPQFKAEVVIEALMGQSSQAELCRKHNLGQDQLKWKHQLVDNAASLFETSTLTIITNGLLNWNNWSGG